MKRLKKIILFFAVLAAAYYLLTFSAEVSESVRQSIKICMDILVPSLFPFMFLSIFIVKSGLADFFGKWLEPLFRTVFKLPGSACGAMLTAFIGGYPAGAKSVAELYRNGSITLAQARRMVNFCFCAGPAFMVGTVGGVYLGFPKIGLIMMIAQIIGAIILALFLSFGKKNEPAVSARVKKTGLCDAFMLSASGAASSILSISTMVLIFGVAKSAVCLFIDKNTFIGTLISNLLEITGDLELASHQSFAYITFVTTFGGACIHMQIFSFTAELKISKLKFILSRIVHSSLTTIIGVIMVRFIPLSAYPSATVLGKNVPTAVPSVAGSASLVLLCIVTVLLSPANGMDFSEPICYNLKRRGRD